MTDHDGLYKMLLRTFFREFMEAFFPEAAAAIDFAHVEFLSEEVVVDITGGTKKRLDLLIKTRLKEEDAFILVHQEPQAYFQEEFAERMFIYSARLYEKHRLRVLPVAIFSHRQQLAEPDIFGWSLPFMEVLRFRFYSLQLRKHNWKDYIRSDNPAVAALLSSMGYNEGEKIQLKLEFLRMLMRLELDPAKLELLNVFFDAYLPMTPEEERQVWREVEAMSSKEENKIMEWKTHFQRYAMEEGIEIGMEKGIEKGIEKGLEQGVEKGKMEVARQMIREGLDPALIAKLTGFTLEQIEKWRVQLH
ncbi:Rpn family recombination-promoting nuclease/putative transposase [Paenibacillus mesotrionivorans]|uniref:Rpn family recombination-promoting nuclease/putative transposase n=1 Tax=Paenibacillus mesotrionivorans TaxID=3160968 RepID=A0ACC7P5S8_9BACL